MSPRPSLLNPNSRKLLAALKHFEKTFGKSNSALELQAILGALATVMDLTDKSLDRLTQQIAANYPQLRSLENHLESANFLDFSRAVQQAKKRLEHTEATLILLIRTYLQRVSSKLSATEFVDLTQTAVALLEPSLGEAQHLIYIALKTFGQQRSQPIPPLGQRLPNVIDRLLARLVRYQKIIRTENIETVVMPLTTAPLSPDRIYTALSNSAVILPPELDTQDGIDDLARIVRFKLQFKTVSARSRRSATAIAAQLTQAIAEFQAHYSPESKVAQPIWDNDLSVSSLFFTPDNFATAGNDFPWLPPKSSAKNLKDETNS